jgi:hypothetical protein
MLNVLKDDLISSPASSRLLLPISIGKEGVSVKWRFLSRVLLPFHAVFSRIEAGQLQTGGSGIECKPGQRTILWDYICLVNNAIGSKQFDPLSCHALAAQIPFRNYAKRYQLCGIFMLVRIFADSTFARKNQTARDGEELREKKRRKVQLQVVEAVDRTEPSDKSNRTEHRADVPAKIQAQVLRVYHQYEAGCKVLSHGSKSLEQTLFPYLRINRETFLVDVNMDGGLWTCAEEWDFLDVNHTVKDVHPLLRKRWPDLSALETAQDREARKLAAALVRDLSRIPMSADKEFERLFTTETSERDLQRHKGMLGCDPRGLTAHVLRNFNALTESGFPEAYKNI